MPALADTNLDQDWICETARTDAPEPSFSTPASPHTRNWITAGSGHATLAANPTLRCPFRLVVLQTDQYIDPWKDVGLSMDAGNRQRSQYVGGNPVAMVDADGHRRTTGLGRGCAGDRTCEIHTVDRGGVVSGLVVEGVTVKPVMDHGSAAGQVQSSHNAAVVNKVTQASGIGKAAIPPTMYYDLAMKAQEHLSTACAEGAPNQGCADANKWASQATGALTDNCSSGFTQVAVGSSWCNGISGKELVWNAAVAGSWFIGGRSATGAAQGSKFATSGRIVIGEDMARVRAAATANDAGVYNASAGALRRGDRAIMAENRAWLRGRMRAGEEVLDIGPAPGRANYPFATSDFYMMERGEIWRAAHPLYRPLY